MALDFSTDDYLPFRFNISGNLIRKLGEESIANKNVAVLELIKNSYDAHASSVELAFSSADTTPASIIVKDNGDGMTYAELENKWMTIAAPHKSQIKKAWSGQRLSIGEKGIGRLSTESLGRKTILSTMPRGESQGYEIVFDWEEYQKKGARCTEIVNHGKRFKKRSADKGTTLTISELKHDWTDFDAQRALLKDIYLLNPPKNKIKGFKVNTKFSNPLGVEKITPKFLNQCAYHLKTKLIGGTRILYEFTAKNGKREKGAIELANRLKCGDAVFELFFFYKSAYHFENALKVSISPQEITSIKKVLDEYAGIKLYRDNFRVKPYGEPGNDWIGLDKDAQNLTMCPRNSSIFGLVHISKTKNPEIRDTATREGIIDTLAFMDLKTFVRTSILKLFITLRSGKESHKVKARKTLEAKKKHKVKPIQEKKRIDYEEKMLVDIRGAFPDIFHEKLQDELNSCYNYGCITAAFILSRKLVENLIYSILERKFPEKKELWWNNTYNLPLCLTPLIKNLNENKKEFKPNVTKYIGEVIPLAEKIRNESNPIVHDSFRYFESRDELNKFKISHSVQLLVKIYNALTPKN